MLEEEEAQIVILVRMRREGRKDKGRNGEKGKKKWRKGKEKWREGRKLGGIEGK